MFSSVVTAFAIGLASSPVPDNGPIDLQSAYSAERVESYALAFICEPVVGHELALSVKETMVKDLKSFGLPDSDAHDLVEDQLDYVEYLLFSSGKSGDAIGCMARIAEAKSTADVIADVLRYSGQ